MAELLKSLTCFLLVAASCAIPIVAYSEPSDNYNKCVNRPHDSFVRLDTELGEVDIELFGTRAPITVCNFLRYVEAGFFDGGRFFRTVRPGNQRDKLVKINVVQADIHEGTAGAFPPIPMERTSKTGIHHIDGTISMARETPDSASSSFFLCIGDQPELDFGGKRNPDGQGFAAFGRVTRGMAVVKYIWMAPASGEMLTPPVAVKRLFVLDR